MILAQVWEAIFAQTSTGHSIFSRAFQAQILLGCEASVPQLSKLVHNLHIHAKMGALWTKFKVKIYHGDWDQIFHTFKKWTFWHPLTQKLVKMVMPQYIEGGFMLFSKIHDSHSTTSDQISWLHSSSFRKFSSLISDLVDRFLSSKETFKTLSVDYWFLKWRFGCKKMWVVRKKIIEMGSVFSSQKMLTM